MTSFVNGLSSQQLLELIAIAVTSNPPPSVPTPGDLAIWIEDVFVNLGYGNPATKFVNHLAHQLFHHKLTFDQAIEHVANHGTSAEQTALLGTIATDMSMTRETFALTVNQDTFAGTGGDTFNAPLAGGVFGNVATLTNGDSLTDTGSSNVLNAWFDGCTTVSGVTISGIQTWNINQTGSCGTIAITGDATSISGLHTLSFNDWSGTGSLLIGDNAEPVVLPPGGANGFTINVSNAVGTGCNGVDVDIAAGAFTGHDTIHVNASIVGGFPETNGSYIIPDPILNTTNNYDDYDPNWCGYLGDAFAIAAGASAGPNGAVGFATWDVSSTGAKNAGTLNILALGGEGSDTATTINLTDDGSNTMLYATVLSDSTLNDWSNVTTINLSGTSGFVTITGAEVCFNPCEGGGLLTDDTSALTTIDGGTGNSFYDLTSLTLAAASNPAALFDGGHSTKGDSEIAFNNDVLTGGMTVNISHIQVLDDASCQQGGTIDMADFPGLAPLNVAYTMLQGGSVPAGFELLQLLGSNGGTTTCLGSDLNIDDSSVNFAVNMADMSDGCYSGGCWSGYDISISGLGWSSKTVSTLDLWVPDDGIIICPSTETSDAVTASYVPDFFVDNYTVTNIYLPYEDSYVILGGCSGFVDDAPNQQANITVNFGDNTADTGGSPPGSPDNLVLGVTNFTTELCPADIGVSTVSILTSVLPSVTVTTTINDNGAGSFEIGATNVTNLNAQSTSHLIMDLPGTDVNGIDVNGSACGQNLLQGTSGPVTFDWNGHCDGLTLESSYVGNDVLTGGVGGHGVTYFEFGGVMGTYCGNPGDNYFPEGGCDIVNISHAAKDCVYSTVWFGQYDVSNSGDFLGPNCNSGVGCTYEQAITDINYFGCETYVDGYGGHNILTVNGFNPGDSTTKGDIINFDASDWAAGWLNTGGFDQGLVNEAGCSLTVACLHNADAFINNVGFAGEITTSDGTPLGIPLCADVTIDFHRRL